MKAFLVTSSLGSVKKICQAGHTVVFGDGRTFIMNKNIGEVTWLREQDGNYMYSQDAIRQFFTCGRDEQDRCKPQIQTQQGRGCGRSGRRRSRGHDTRGMTARRALDTFRPTRKMHH